MTATLAALALALAAQGGAEPQPAEWADCLIVHYRADGTRTETPPRRATTSEPGQASAAARSSGNGAGSSSVSASSRNGVATSTAAASSTGGARRSVTQTREDGRCVVTIDER